MRGSSSSRGDDDFALALQSAMFSAAAPRPKSLSEMTEEVAKAVLVEMVEDALWETLVDALTESPLGEENAAVADVAWSCVEVEAEPSSSSSSEDEETGFSDEGEGDSPERRESPVPARRLAATVAEIEEPLTPRYARLVGEDPDVDEPLLDSEDFDEEGVEDDEFVVEANGEVLGTRSSLDVAADEARRALQRQTLLFAPYAPRPEPPTSRNNAIRRDLPSIAEVVGARRVGTHEDDAFEEDLLDESAWVEPRALCFYAAVGSDRCASVELAASRLASRPFDPADAKVAARLVTLALRQRDAARYIEAWLQAAQPEDHDSGLVATAVFRHRCGCGSGDPPDDGLEPLFAGERPPPPTTDYDVVVHGPPTWTDADAAAFVDRHAAVSLDAVAAVALRVAFPRTLARLLALAASKPPVAAVLSTLDAIFRRAPIGHNSKRDRRRRADAVARLLAPRRPTIDPGRDRAGRHRAPLCVLLLRARALFRHLTSSGFNDVLPSAFVDLACDVLPLAATEDSASSSDDAAGPAPPWDAAFAAWLQQQKDHHEGGGEGGSS